MKKEGSRRRSVLIAHGDPAWVDGAKSRLERLGFEVTACPEPAWAADLLSEKSAFDLAAVSSEIDPASQAEILRTVKDHPRPPRLMILLDNLDTASILYRKEGHVLTHRVSEDPEAFVRAVVEQLGMPSRGA